MHSAQLAPDVVRAPANRETATQPQGHAAVSQDVAAALLHKLGQSKAALSLICMIFVDGSEVNANDAAGAMGTLQFAQQRLGECMDIVGEMSRPLDDLYWGTFCAHSLVSLLEDHCWADSWKWTMPADVLSGSLSAARDSVAKAIELLVAEGAKQ